MLICMLCGLGVIGGLFLLSLVGKLLRTAQAKSLYKYFLLTGYIGSVLWLTLANRWGLEVSHIRFQPFHVVRQILNCWFGFKKIAASTCRAVFKNSAHLFDSAHASPIEDLLLNIVLFFPFGFLLPYLWPRVKWWHTLLLAGVFSGTIEAIQYWAHIGCCDIDDIINNLVGTCIGYGCWMVYKRLAR